MNEIQTLLANNRIWSNAIKQNEPDFFPQLARQQKPTYLWIGCADSRVPANEIVGLLPGELFVHRNVANLVYPADLNCLSVVEYAVKILQVRFVIVCGHYGCGGVKAAIEGKAHGGIDNWLTKIKDTYARHLDDVHSLDGEEKRLDRLCELNVMEQVKTLSHTTIVQDAWAAGQELAIHGWIYGLEDGVVKDLDVCMNSIEQVPPTYRFRRG